MIGRVILAALLAGIVAGVFYGAIQQVRLTPLILEAEKYENAGSGHSHDTAAATTQSPVGTAGGPAEAEEAWAPVDGFERSFFTFLASMIAGAGFAALLAGVSLLSGVRITPGNGLVWGIAGFLAVHLAPAASLPPELPGMPAGELIARQIWWVGTIAATGLAIWLFTQRDATWTKVAAIVLVAIPHIVGAPQPPTHESSVPAGLSAEFAANTLAGAAVLWLMIGGFLGFAMNRLVKEA
jgi:cobalt transporter subunit CbtA